LKLNDLPLYLYKNKLMKAFRDVSFSAHFREGFAQKNRVRFGTALIQKQENSSVGAKPFKVLRML
jgi:hypothetical protein